MFFFYFENLKASIFTATRHQSDGSRSPDCGRLLCVGLLADYCERFAESHFAKTPLFRLGTIAFIKPVLVYNDDLRRDLKRWIEVRNFSKKKQVSILSENILTIQQTHAFGKEAFYVSNRLVISQMVQNSGSEIYCQNKHRC